MNKSRCKKLLKGFAAVDAAKRRWLYMFFYGNRAPVYPGFFSPAVPTDFKQCAGFGNQPKG